MKTCLLVDDSRVIRKVARQIFEISGYTCNEAENGLVALDICRRELPDLILLDWNMPEMDGLEFLKALRREPDGDKSIVVFCTRQNDPAQIWQALMAGANEYIMKPFDADIVTGKLELLGLVDAA
ncbi:MAG: PleD family two-component system response regulator [Bdellovibrionales bacterium]